MVGTIYVCICLGFLFCPGRAERANKQTCRLLINEEEFDNLLELFIILFV